MPVTFTYPTSSDNLNPLYTFDPDPSGSLFTCTGNCVASWTVQTCDVPSLFWLGPGGSGYLFIYDDQTASTLSDGQTSATLMTISSRHFDLEDPSFRNGLMIGCYNQTTATLDEFDSVRFYVHLNNWNYGDRTVAASSTSGLSPSSTSTTATSAAASSSGTATPNPIVKLSTGAIVGIVVGAIALIGLIVGIFIIRRRKQKKNAPKSGIQAQNRSGYMSQGSSADIGPNSAKAELVGTVAAGGPFREKTELPASDSKLPPSVNSKSFTETSPELGATSLVGRQQRYTHMPTNEDEKQVSEAERQQSQLPEHLSYQPYQPQRDQAELGQHTRETGYIPYNRNVGTPELGQNTREDGIIPYQRYTGPTELGDYRSEPGYIPYQQPAAAQNRTSDTHEAVLRQSSPPTSPVQYSRPSDSENINALKAQNRELQRQIEVNESLQRLRQEQAALDERIRLAEMQAREQG